MWFYSKIIDENDNITQCEVHLQSEKYTSSFLHNHLQHYEDFKNALKLLFWKFCKVNMSDL